MANVIECFRTRLLPCPTGSVFLREKGQGCPQEMIRSLLRGMVSLGRLILGSFPRSISVFHKVRHLIISHYPK